jgi:transglutaminase-like putative cysteine protease
MKFRIKHQTEYQYAQPASDSFAELRICPRDLPSQRVLSRRLVLTPDVPVESYIDYFGNYVEFFSVPFRHQRLSVESIAEVETLPLPEPGESLQVTVAESLQIFKSLLLNVFDYLQPTLHVPLHHVLRPIRNRFFRPKDTLGDALLGLNTWIYSHFTYRQGITDISTPLDEVIRTRQGVCQDFAHLMLSILRSSGIPARYVSGYIESVDPTLPHQSLVGTAASHAWVEVLLPGGLWWGLDPTNNQPAGERHVKVASGRDYQDIAPLRGTYKGARHQDLKVIVSVERKQPATP